MIGFIKTDSCPICDREVNAFKKSGQKYNGKYICTSCYRSIIRTELDASRIKDMFLEELKKAVRGELRHTILGE